MDKSVIKSLYYTSLLYIKIDSSVYINIQGTGISILFNTYNLQ